MIDTSSGKITLTYKGEKYKEFIQCCCAIWNFMTDHERANYCILQRRLDTQNGAKLFIECEACNRIHQEEVSAEKSSNCEDEDVTEK